VTKDELKYLLEKTEALLSGHFVLSSGRHSDQYVQCARLFENPLHGELVGNALADLFRDQEIDMVAGPALGGVLLAYDVGRSLGKRVVFAERKDGVMMFRRGFAVKPGEKVLLVEDVVTTGGSIKEVAELLKEAGAEIVGMGTIILRKSPGVSVDLPLKALLEVEVPSYDSEECPMCENGEPAVKPGSRPGAK